MIKRRVHKIQDSTYQDSRPGVLERDLNDRLAPAERIVGTHYIDGYWWIITESFGLGPITKP